MSILFIVIGNLDFIWLLNFVIGVGKLLDLTFMGRWGLNA